MMQHKKLTAYLIGAGVGATLVVIPYIFFRPIMSLFRPEISGIYQPFFLIPIVWGLWNLFFVCVNRRPSIGIWGAILGFLMGLSICLLLYAGGYWFWAGIFIPVFAPAIYFLAWDIIIGSLNLTYGIE